MSRERTSRERMQAIVERWQRSGLSAAVFCRRQKIDPQRLSYWKGVLGVARAQGRVRRVSFTPVQVVDLGLPGGACLEVVLNGGDRLLLREGLSPALLREVLAALRERC